MGRFDERGELVEIDGYIVDQTEHRLAEERSRQGQKMEAIGRLAGGVAHDFNNLLGVITGYSDLMRKDLTPDHPAHARLRQICKAADRASDLVRQLLAFSRKQLLEPRVLDLTTVVVDVETMLRRLIGEDIQLVTVLQEGLGRVRADPGQIEQVMLNLAVNARDAMPKGGRLIIEASEVQLDEAFERTHPGSRRGPYVMVALSDTGQGMDAETLTHIFEPFFTTKEMGKGTGLGLSIVYGIVQQSGGFITVYSEPGHGSTFRVYLPRVEDPAEPRRPAPAADEQALRGTGTILLVEDDELLRPLIREFLEGAGYRVLVCAARAEIAVGVDHQVGLARAAGQLVALHPHGALPQADHGGVGAGAAGGEVERAGDPPPPPGVQPQVAEVRGVHRGDVDRRHLGIPRDTAQPRHLQVPRLTPAKGRRGVPGVGQPARGDRVVARSTGGGDGVAPEGSHVVPGIRIEGAGGRLHLGRVHHLKEALGDEVEVHVDGEGRRAAAPQAHRGRELASRPFRARRPRGRDASPASAVVAGRGGHIGHDGIGGVPRTVIRHHHLGAHRRRGQQQRHQAWQRGPHDRWPHTVGGADGSMTTAVP